ncbi:MAG: class I SAM-dependent methyltransferase [Rhodobacteraceae bacterium]|nr:class I SAM-dependent methyltransferase [Paracoccaceae bacterium]
MPLQPAMHKAAGLVSQIEALAALAVWLGRDGAPPDPALTPALERVASALGREDFADLSPAETQMVRGFLHAFLRQALDFVEAPARPAAWSFEDPVILQAIGQTSRTIVRGLADLAAAEPALGARLGRPARFLDAGCGVGWISIDAARHWPSLSVEGIDIFPPALALAARNLSAAGPGDANRVTFRHQDVTTLAPDGRFALAFLAAPFIPEDLLPRALERLFGALEPGGWLAFGLFEAPPAPLAQALLGLRVTRFGGRAWTPDEARALLDRAGFATPATASVSQPPARLVIGRRP